MKQSSGSTRARARANRPNRATGTGIGTPAAAASSLRRSSSRRGNSLDATTATTTATGGILATLSMNNNEEEDDDGRGSTNARITKKKTLLRKRNKKPLAIESSSSDSENNENSASENSEKEATNSHDASTGSDINGNQKQTNSKENRSTYYSVDDSKSDYDMSDDDHDDNNNDDTNNCKPTPERSRNTTGSSSMNDMSSNNSSSQSAERTTTTNNNNHAVQKTLFATAQPKRRGLASQTTKTTRAKPRNPKTNITSSGSSSDAVSLQDSNDSEPEQEESLEEEENEEEDTASHCRSSSNANNSSHESISSSSSSSSSVLLTKDDDSDESDYNPNADSDEEEDDVDEKQQQSKDCNVVGGGGNVGCSNGSVASEKDNDDDNLDPDLVVQDQDELHCFARPETDRSPEEQLLADGNASPDNSHTTETGDDDDDETLDPDLVIQDQDELRCFARTESTRSPEELQVVDNASPDTSKKDKSFNDSHITEKDDDKNPDPDFADLDQDELHCFESPESTRSPPELRKDGNASPDETCSTNNDEYDKENCIHDKSLFHTQHQPNEVDTSKELKDGCNSNQARLSTFGDGDEHCSMLEKKVASDSPLRKKSSAENLSPFSGDRPIGNEPSMDVEVYLDNDATDCDSQSDIDDEEWIAEIVASDDDSENGTVNDSINEPPFPSHDAKPQQGSHASVSLSSQIGPTEEQLVQTSVPSLVTEKVKSTNDTTLNLLSPVNLEFTNTVTKDGATCKVNNTDDLPLLHDQATLRTSLQQDEMDCLPNASISSCHTSRPNDCIVSVVCDELRALAIGNEATRLPETQKRSTECLDVRSCLLGDFTLTSQVQHGVGSASKGSGTKDREVRVQRYRREGSVKRGKWKFGTKIGSGAFGVVHIGMNMETGALMAVKSLKLEPGAMKDAKREIQLLKSLQHENIVRYLGAEMDSKYLHIFQEWVPAGSVTTMLAKFGPFPLPVVRNYLEQILRGIEYLHDNSIMHRDVKGSNILVNDFGIIKLADFGASKRFVQLKSDMMLSLTVRGSKLSVFITFASDPFDSY